MSWLYYNISSGLIKEKYGSVHPEGHNWKHKHCSLLDLLTLHRTPALSDRGRWQLVHFCVWEGVLCVVLCVCVCVCVCMVCVCVRTLDHLCVHSRVSTYTCSPVNDSYCVISYLGIYLSVWMHLYEWVGTVHEYGSMCLCLCCMFKKGSVFANCVKTASLTSHLGTM